jgi:peptidoglycan/xylan/chitin deacetylase (PgdA/CDA1 family)
MILAIIILAALLWWINRPVPVTVNGTPAEVRVGSSLGDVLHEEEISVNPGNYVSVSGNVLKANMGHEFSATVNGEALSPEDAEKYRVGGSESIDFSDGQDITEEFTAESEVLKPYLRMEGSGYSIQYISQWGRPGELQHRKGKESGESADVVVKEAQDCVITCMEPSPQGDTKYIALTFDDGPLSPYTEQYLDIMEKYGVKATFFNLGENTQANPELARRVVQEGHQLSNHTMAHNQLTSVDAQTIYNEITRSAKVIEDATGVHTTHIRPPYGDFTERSWLGSGGSITATIRWNGDSEDWRLPGPEAIVNNSLVNLHSGTIVLMHDGGGDRSQDVDALPALIERAQSEGYQFVTISDLMRACGLPEDICSGTASMPEDAVWPEEIHPDDIAAAAAAS